MIDTIGTDWSRFGGRIKSRRHALTAEELAAIGRRRSRLLDRVREAYGAAGAAAGRTDDAGAVHAGPRPLAAARCPAD